MKRHLFTAVLPFLLSFPLHAQHAALTSRLEQAIKGKKAEVGIAIILDGKDTVTVNNNVRYPLMSVFKFHQAVALADYMSRPNLPLSTRLHIKPSNLKTNTYSPMRDKHPHGGIDMSVADLLSTVAKILSENVSTFLGKGASASLPIFYILQKEDLLFYL